MREITNKNLNGFDITFHIQAICGIDLSNFPMDSQLCTLEIESYGYTMVDLIYFWNKELNPVEVNPLPQGFHFRGDGGRGQRLVTN